MALAMDFDVKLPSVDVHECECDIKPARVGKPAVLAEERAFGEVVTYSDARFR